MNGVLQHYFFSSWLEWFLEDLNISYVIHIMRTDIFIFLSYVEAIESGRLPGSILDEIPCKYNEGALTCEVSNLFF